MIWLNADRWKVFAWITTDRNNWRIYVFAGRILLVDYIDSSYFQTKHYSSYIDWNTAF